MLAYRSGRQNIILSNRNAYHNMMIKLGDISSSDHLPLIVIIANKPILAKTELNHAMKKADWNKYKSIIEEITTA